MSEKIHNSETFRKNNPKYLKFIDDENYGRNETPNEAINNMGANTENLGYRALIPVTVLLAFVIFIAFTIYKF